jgi:hypothetical protein
MAKGTTPAARNESRTNAASHEQPTDYRKMRGKNQEGSKVELPPIALKYLSADLLTTSLPSFSITISQNAP